jgi:stress-induced morphogen
MAGNTSRETHFRFTLHRFRSYFMSNCYFRVVITSEAFQSKMQPARHRMVYGLLKEEMAREGGIHALQLRTRTPQEEEQQLAREKEEQGESIDGTIVEKS